MTARSLLTALALLTAAPACADTAFPARLAGHAVLPALSLIVPPADAPRDAWVSGKFTGPDGPARRVTAPMSLPGAYGIARPFIGQPLQGLSGFAMQRADDGSIYALTDNGFGSKANSPDALLFFHRIVPDFETGTVEVRETVFLRDPDFRVPFRIALEGTSARYLTGADFDPESIQIVGEDVWIGEEFGPYLIRATLDGRVLSVHPTISGGTELRGPDHPAVSALSAAGTDWQVPRSGGYEGMALQPGSGLLWAMLEKPILAPDGTPEGQFLCVMAFDPAAAEWTGDAFRFPLADGATAIGDRRFQLHR
jgi:hypothetical protein